MDGNKTDRGKRKLLFNRNANQTGNVEWFENRSWWSYFRFCGLSIGFSSNNSGDAAVALNCVINFTTAGREGDIFRGESKLVNETRKTAVYDIHITNQEQKLVAKFTGTVYKIGKK